jgi:hypothetical protein
MKTQLNITVAMLGLLATFSLPAAERTTKPDAWKETLTAPAEKFLTIGRNDYFILEPCYQLVLEGKQDGKQATLTITVLAETMQIGDAETRIVEEREVIGGQLVEVSRNFFAIGATSKNVYYFGEEVDMYKDGKIVSHDGAWCEGQGVAKHGVLIPGNVKVGDRYYQEQAPKVAMDRAENVSMDAAVKTLAGKFERCLKTKETTPLEAGTEYKYYAPGVGLVQDGDLKLVKFGVAKP